MVKLIKSEALVLRRFRQGDTSLVVHGFTRERGRVAFIAKGARAGGKRAPVPLVPVTLLEFVWAPSTRSDLQLLRDVSLLETFGPIHDDLERLAWAQAALEVLGRTLTGEEAYPELFTDTVEYLRALARSGEKAVNLFLRFRLRALQHLGYGLQLEIEGEPGDAVYFSPRSGTLFASPPRGGGSLRMGLGSWKSMSALAQGDYERARRLRLAGGKPGEISRVLDAAYREAFDRWPPLESLSLLDSERLLNAPGRGAAR